MAIKERLTAGGDGREPKDVSLRNGVRSEAIGCVGHFSGGRLVSFALAVEAVAEDCALAAVVISP